jgi:hypothetical protein
MPKALRSGEGTKEEQNHRTSPLLRNEGESGMTSGLDVRQRIAEAEWHLATPA